MSDKQQWYIVKQENETCAIVSSEEKPKNVTSWGEFATREEAITKRIGLIRAGKCKPVTPIT